MTKEKMILQGEGLLVSASRVNIGGTTYSTANITSVSKRATPAEKPGCSKLLVAAGALLALISLAVIAEDPGAGLTVLALGLLGLGAGIAWMRSSKPTYSLVFASASGEAEAHSSPDEALIDRLVAAVNEAIVARG